MSIKFGPIIAIADPDTLELLGLEVPFFMEKIRDKKLTGAWDVVARWVAKNGILFIPPKAEVEEASRQIWNDLQPVLV